MSATLQWKNGKFLLVKYAWHGSAINRLPSNYRVSMLETRKKLVRGLLAKAIEDNAVGGAMVDKRSQHLLKSAIIAVEQVSSQFMARIFKGFPRVLLSISACFTFCQGRRDTVLSCLKNLNMSGAEVVKTVVNLEQSNNDDGSSSIWLGREGVEGLSSFALSGSGFHSLPPWGEKSAAFWGPPLSGSSGQSQLDHIEAARVITNLSMLGSRPPVQMVTPSSGSAPAPAPTYTAW